MLLCFFLNPIWFYRITVFYKFPFLIWNIIREVGNGIGEFLEEIMYTSAHDPLIFTIFFRLSLCKFQLTNVAEGDRWIG